MSFWSKTKEVAQAAVSPVKGTATAVKQGAEFVGEKYRERYSHEEKYANVRIARNEVRAKEMESKAQLAQQEAKYAQARTVARQNNPLVRMAQNIGGRQRQQTVRSGKKAKVVAMPQRDQYAHIFGNGTVPNYGSILGGNSTAKNYDAILGSNGKKKKGNSYEHIFGK